MLDSGINLLGYEVGEQIYLGSRTVVCRAMSEARKPVIIKFMRNECPSFNELVQFRNQYVITRNLDIDGVVRPIALERYNNSYALVMEDFGGISLEEYFNQLIQEPSINTVDIFLDVAIKIAIALDQLHSNRIIHKDIKPANILINPDTKQVKLIDFSIASVLPRETQQLKNPKILEGTLAYISPEQTGRMNRGIDYRTDFYSLGVTFYQLLTQQLPFASIDLMELLHCHIAKQPESVTSLKPGIPQQLGDIVSKLMAKNAEARYQSALGLKYDLILCQQYWNNQRKIPGFELGQKDLCDRFIIPEKLYGRETEVAKLLAAFARVISPKDILSSAGNCELMMVKGVSGIGKTAVINEVHKPIVQQQGYFIKGKYDQFQRQTPFSAFLQAFRNLIRQLLHDSDVQLQSWKQKILEVLGENAQVIIDVIPELEQIIGKQPPAIELEGTAALNRFNLLFRNFIQIFATSAHPLVIFLDDLQWADSASLKLLHLLATENKSGHILIIGAYRDNEVPSAHPLILTLAQIGQMGTVINEIAIAPLQISDINHLVADTLNCSLPIALPLAELVQQKTQGNPFFCTQFLKLLYDEKLIKFNLQSGHWECDISQVRERSLTQDVVELMVEVLQKLPPATQNLLSLAACIGNEFDLNTLAVVLEQSPTDVAVDLWKALQEELILPQHESYKFFQTDLNQANQKLNDLVIDSTSTTVSYKFLHDRVQQAAYSLIDEHQKPATHLKIGKLLLANTTVDVYEDNIFDIVNHLNAGINLIKEDGERQELAQLNLTAATKAKAATAYIAAQEYLDTGISLLAADCWEKQYDLAFSLSRQKIEIEYLNGNFEVSEKLTFAVLPNLKNNIDKADIYNVLIVQYTLQLRYEESINTGRYALNLLNLELPDTNFPQEIEKEYILVNQLLAGREISSIIDLPPMESPEKMIAAKLLMNLDAVCYNGKPELFPVVALKLVNLSLMHGNTAESARGFADYAVILGAIFQDYKSSYEFGLLAVNLSNKLNNSSAQCRTYFMFASFVNHWSQPLRLSSAINDDAYRFGLESGELQNSGYSLFAKTLNLFCQGTNLGDILTYIPGFIEFTNKTQNLATTDCLTALQQVIGNLSGMTAHHRDFAIANTSEEEYWQLYQSRQSGLAMCCHQIIKSQALYIYGDYDGAYACALEAQANIMRVIGFFCVAVHNFYFSLALVHKYDQASDDDTKAEYLQQLQANQAQMKIWADSCPENFLHKYLLVEAEMLRLAGDNTEAIELYDKVIHLAKENHYIQEEALSYELAAKFYLGWNKPKIAQVYIKDAYYAYARWGAKSKVNHLEKEYPQLLAPIIIRQASDTLSLETVVLNATQVINTSSTTLASVFDLATVIKSSQAISSEIDVARLVQSLMEVVLENTGASKIVMILCKNAQMFVEASAEVAGETIIQRNNFNCLAVDESSEVPISVLNYVKNTGRLLLVNDVAADITWLADSYIQQQKPQCILCLPIHRQGKLTGLLYLENRIATEVFTSDRLELLELICSQAAISLENAQLYERSQDYAKQLETSLENLKQAQLQLVQSEKMSALGSLVSGIAHEINNPIGCISGNIEPANQYIQDLFKVIEGYQNEYTQPSDKLRQTIDNVDLEYIREDLPNLMISMQQSIDRIYDISISLRTFSRSDTQKPVLCNIHECINSTILILRHRLKASEKRPEIEIVKDYGNIPEFKCFPGQLNQVFMNLIANAIDALEDSNAGKDFVLIQNNPNRITITTKISQNREFVAISIKDNGVGMSPEVKNKIFEHLFTTKPVGKGTGLGLAIARQIVIDKHGGTIEVNSIPNEGAEFVIQLPLNN
ncbi:AAA family ATPase [Calothrix sp. UHCC 0171]|uniref:trifunctional serine/threonine-protein kinase/ATP-binding protein/sensor histidine kinase n=1 Tax=Calothrix sp. UHCC 0171 TaxID=3110245 RepID=UPI002B218825|nr:AAA family ATPase [Calothrix sp. UHCC 0171]MEA5570453.1 AAA family ATPase [Calothrix sp. UHCC 0171]